MQLDRTAIVIAQRNADELFDLSLVVLRNYWAKLVPVAILGTLPFALLNYFLLRPLTDYDQLTMASRDYVTVEGFQIKYLWMMLCLVFLQAPLAMSGVTYLLGQAVFLEESTLKKVGWAVFKRWFSLVWVLGVQRGALLSILFLAWQYATPTVHSQWQPIGLSFFFVVGFFLLRSFRPFATEILLLEECPLVTRKSAPSTVQSYSKRSAWLHSGSGDLFSVEIAVSFIAMVFIGAMCGGGIFLMGTVVGLWSWGWWMDAVVFPLVLWSMALWETVIRFLLYLNTRIRLEGWEVYLRLNAELHRMRGAAP